MAQETPKVATPATTPVAAPKAGRVVPQTIYPDAEAAVKEAQSRTKGPRRAFKTTFNGKDTFIVSHNEGRAAGVAFLNVGGKVEELGRAPRAAKPVGVDGIMAAVNSLPEAERAAVLAQLKSLATPKK